MSQNESAKQRRDGRNKSMKIGQRDRFFEELTRFMLENGIKYQNQVSEFWDWEKSKINGIQRENIRTIPAWELGHIGYINENTHKNPFNPDKEFKEFNLLYVLYGKRESKKERIQKKRLIELEKTLLKLQGAYEEAKRQISEQEQRLGVQSEKLRKLEKDLRLASPKIIKRANRS